MSHSSSFTASPLPRRYVLYLPAGHPDSSAVCSAAEEILCDRLGGVTGYPARGTFRNENGERVQEKIEVLESYCQVDRWTEVHEFLEALAAAAGALLGQEAVACSVDGHMRLISSDGQATDSAFSGPVDAEHLEALANRFIKRGS